MPAWKLIALILAFSGLHGAFAADVEQSEPDSLFRPLDVFELEYANQPQISPNGKTIVYLRTSMDIMKDRPVTHIWQITAKGKNHRPLTEKPGSYRSLAWSPSGDRLAWVSGNGDREQIHIRWMDTGQTGQITHLHQSPQSITWSPDGTRIAFFAFVPGDAPTTAQMPPKPDGAEWAPPVKKIDSLFYKRGGGTMREPGYDHLFVVPAEGGTPRQLTRGDFDHDGTISWSPNGKYILIASNRQEDADYENDNTEVLQVEVETGSTRALTDRVGPDFRPRWSPDGKRIAWVGYDTEIRMGYSNVLLSVMDRDGSNKRVLTASLDRSVGHIQWAENGTAIYFDYVDRGKTFIGRVSLAGKVTTLVKDLGGTSLGRPYSSGAWSVSNNDRLVFLASRPDRPADIAVTKKGGSARVLTALNDDLLAHRMLGKVEEIWYKSSHDGRDIQGWIVTPPGFDPEKKYPLILEIHGGPFASYGPHFAAEVQLYAAAGYVVLYTNPRGSTSYGDEFANLIHHNYPNEDYFDLESGVDAVIARGYIDETRLFVTGGSGGGVLTAWIVGKTDRYRAAAVQKPVINWTSFVLTADSNNNFARNWFGSYPWDDQENYWKRSPLSLVGNVKTPTMLITGEADVRTPITETEQFYQALKIRKVDSVMIRIPGAGHGIARRPSNLLAKVLNVLAWFKAHDVSMPAEGEAGGIEEE